MILNDHECEQCGRKFECKIIGCEIHFIICEACHTDNIRTLLLMIV